MARRPPPDPKVDALRQRGSLHPRPEAVRDALFVAHDFFDARDLVQVKYEMLRRVRVEGHAVSRTAAAFGFSRPSYYQAQAAFRRAGLPALVPQKPGPRHAHKLREEVVDFLAATRAHEGAVRAAVLARLVEERFGVSAHPRSIERALARRGKARR